MYALADCNNFFASCERVFRPELNGKPVIVLSNNDGCAVARSNEAKALGIKMGDPYFKLKPLIEKYGVAVFSSNFALYGDMSRRVQEVLRGYAPFIEVYSIDESFLDLSGMEQRVDFDAYAKEISRECWRQTSIPVSVGIAPTKTLARIASKLCKRYPKLQGGCYMHRPQDVEKVLRRFPVEDVWGIGCRMMRRLETMGVATAWDYAQLPESTVRGLFHLPGFRTWKELRGIPCIEQEDAHMHSLFSDTAAAERESRLSSVIDSVHAAFGSSSLLFGVQGDGRFHMAQDHCSPHYTTRWTDLPGVSVH